MPDRRRRPPVAVAHRHPIRPRVLPATMSRHRKQSPTSGTVATHLLPRAHASPPLSAAPLNPPLPADSPARPGALPPAHKTCSEACTSSWRLRTAANPRTGPRGLCRRRKCPSHAGNAVNSLYRCITFL